MYYGWGYLYANGLVTPELIRDTLIAGAIAVALVLGFVIGMLAGYSDAKAEMRPPAASGGVAPTSGRRAA